MLAEVVAFTMATRMDSLLDRLFRIWASSSVVCTTSQSTMKPSRCRRSRSSMAVAASAGMSSATFVALKPARMAASRVTSLVKSKQFKLTASIYAKEGGYKSDGGSGDSSHGSAGASYGPGRTGTRVRKASLLMGFHVKVAISEDALPELRDD